MILLSNSLDNAKNIAANEVHGVIHLTALSVMTEGGRSIDHFRSFTLHQSAVSHHQFTLVLAHDSMGKPQNQNLEDTQDFLGRRITVTFTYKNIANGPERSFTGVITGVGFTKEYGGYGNIVLTGQSPTILLDGAPHIQSFGGSEITRLGFIANRMFDKALGRRFDYRVDCRNNNNQNYICQYNETQYNFLGRIAEAYGEQFYYDGVVLHFGKLPEAEKPLELIIEKDVHEISVQMNARHVNRSYYGYSSSEHELLTTGKSNLSPQGRLAKPAFKVSETLFKTEALQAAPLRAYTYKDVEASQLSANGSAATQMSVVKGKTTVPFLYPGCMVHLSFKKTDSSDNSYFSKVMITEVHHSVNNIGQYEGRFEAISSDMGFMPAPKFEMPKAEPQIATVVNNKNSEGRVQVRFKWQYPDEETDYIRVMTPDAGSSDMVGKNRGFVFIPEIGDQVMVGFQHGHPDRPYVMGGLFHGKIGAGGGADNHKKSIYTRSGCQIVIDDNDGKGSIHIEDPSGNTWHMDGAGNVKVNAPNNVSITAGNNMDINVGQNLTMTVGNTAMFNIFRQMMINTPLLEQLITEYFFTQAGKAFMSSQSEIKLESPDMYLAGEKNLFLHSEEQATVNSQGGIALQGKTGNKHSNAPKKYQKAKPEIKAKCLVHFRPKQNWQGEDFGFDWMRKGDTNLITNGAAIFGDTDYETIVAKQYTDGTFKALVMDGNQYDRVFKTDSGLYDKLELDYEVHNIPWRAKKDATGKEKKDDKGNIIPDEYYCPWLSLYPANTVKPDKSKVPTNFTNTKATLSLIIDIEEEPDLLRFKDNEHFKITPQEINVKGKGKQVLTDAITIECLSEFSTDQTIVIDAIKKNTNPKLPDIAIPAGKLKVWANDAAKRKKAKVLLIQVTTSIQGRKEGVIIGQEDLFKKYLRQTLIDVNVETEAIDFLNDPKFKNGGTYVSNNQVAAYYDKNAPQGFQSLELYIYEQLKKQLKAANPANEHKYDSYYKAIYLGENGGVIDASGNIQNLNGYSSGQFVVLFPGKNDQTASHEFLHSFNLPHSFTNPEANADAKCTYEYAKTENIMDYSHHIPQTRYNLWHWQWVTANASIT